MFTESTAFISRANDIAATSADSFYFTNYLFSSNPLLKTLEMYTMMTWGSVFHWTLDQRPTLVARRLKQPNGITMAPDGKLVLHGAPSAL